MTDIEEDLDLGCPIPLTETLVVEVPVLFWNIAGSDTTNGYKKANGYRGDDLGRYAKKIGFDVFLACEASQYDLRKGVSTGLGITSWMQRAKAIWFTSKVKQIKSNKAYPDSVYAYLKTLKWGAAFFGEKGGKKFAILQIHTDYRAPAKQAKQVQSIFKKFISDCDALGIPRENIAVAGDFNWDYTSGDNPFNSLSDWNFEDKGPKNEMTFMERKRLDGVLAHKNAKITVDILPRTDGKMRLSDHNPVKFILTLK